MVHPELKTSACTTVAVLNIAFSLFSISIKNDFYFLKKKIKTKVHEGFEHPGVEPNQVYLQVPHVAAAVHVAQLKSQYLHKLLVPYIPLGHVVSHFPVIGFPYFAPGHVL